MTIQKSDILQEVERCFGVPAADICNPKLRPERDLIAARRAAIWLMREFLDLSQREIARLLKLSRTTVFNALQYVSKMADLQLEKAIEEIEDKLDELAVQRMAEAAR